MALENNRLDFPNMVDRQLKVSIVEPMGFDGRNSLAFFDPFLVSGRELEFMKNDAFVPPLPTNIETSINSIVATVHKNLKETKRRVTRSVPVEKKHDDKSLLEPPPPLVINLKKTNDSNSNKNTNNNNVHRNNINRDNNRRNNSPAKYPQKSNPQIAADSSPKKKITVNLQKMYRPTRNKNISQIKANSDRKHQQRLYHTTSTIKPNDTNSYDTQKRLRTVLHQKRMLEEILQDHEKIQQDRRNISMEIQIMKQYLADIRSKLDSSLKKLGVKKLVTEKYPRQKKKLIPVQSNLSTASTAKGINDNSKSISINTNTVCKGALRK